MSDFERIYQTDPIRESLHETEKYLSIEISDKDCLKKKEFITLINKPPLISMNLDMPILEKEIQKSDKNAKSKSKSIKQKPKRDNRKSKQTAVAKIQKEL